MIKLLTPNVATNSFLVHSSNVKIAPPTSLNYINLIDVDEAIHMTL